MNKILTILFIGLFINPCFSQNSFGVELGTPYYAIKGINDFDSIRVVTTKSDKGYGFGGIFYDYLIKKNLSIHGKFLLRPTYLSAEVFNYKEQCQFCPIRKGSTLATTNISLEFLPQLQLLNIYGLKVKVFGGVNTSFNFRVKREEDIRFAKGRHPGVAKVINSIDDVFDPVTFSWIYGASAEYSRCIFWAKLQKASQFSTQIIIDGNEHPFVNRWEFLSFSIGYRFIV